MARGPIAQDVSTLEMALVGYQIEQQKIENRIREIQSQLKGKQAGRPSAAAAKKAPGGKRVLSQAARRRISVAQRKRWAEHRKRMAQAAKQG